MFSIISKISILIACREHILNGKNEAKTTPSVMKRKRQKNAHQKEKMRQNNALRKEKWGKTTSSKNKIWSNGRFTESRWLITAQNRMRWQQQHLYQEWISRNGIPSITNAVFNHDLLQTNHNAMGPFSEWDQNYLLLLRSISSPSIPETHAKHNRGA